MYRKEVLIVLDDFNVCGGSERLASTTIETLAQIGFNIDLATFTMPDLAKIQRLFGIKLIGHIRKIHLTDLLLPFEYGRRIVRCKYQFQH